MRSLHDFCRWTHGRRPARFVVILSLLVTACGRQQTSEQTSGMNPLLPAPLGTAWGFIDNRGKIIIPPRFEAAQPYSEGLAAVKREGRWGYIDRKSTRLNSSHRCISYAVFCLKKKKDKLTKQHSVTQ